jgi:hypothetical protein
MPAMPHLHRLTKLSEEDRERDKDGKEVIESGCKDGSHAIAANQFLLAE